MINKIIKFFLRNKNSTEKNSQIPHDLKHLISEKNFELILNYSIDYFRNKGCNNISQANGLLTYVDAGGNMQINFSNVVKHVLNEEKINWKNKTVEFFNKISESKDLENEIVSDFDKAKDYLTIRLQPVSAYDEEPSSKALEDLIYKIDIPETYSVLALDLPTRFRMLTSKDTKVWKQDLNTLFETAHKNLESKIEAIQARSNKWETIEFYTLFDRDYSAAYCINFGNNCNNLIGEMGSLVAIPCRGSVFIHAISEAQQFNTAYKKIAEFATKFFESEEGPISRNLYWYYNNKFIAFEINWKDDSLTYRVPDALVELLIS